MKHTFALLLASCSLLLASCDEGRIPEKSYTNSEKGRVAKLEADIEGTNTWNSNYSIVFAGFADDNEYSQIAKNIKPDANGHVSLELAGIPENVTQLEICVINSIRERVATLYTADAPSTSDTIRVTPTDKVSLSMYDYLQNSVFDKQCSHCHSGNDWAASLNLNKGKSYADLVGKASHKVEGKERVTSGNADNSVLYEVLSSGLSADWKYDHSKIMVTDAANLKLIKEWINSGAKE